MSEQQATPPTPPERDAPLLTDAERARAWAMFGGNRELRRRIKAQARKGERQ